MSNSQLIDSEPSTETWGARLQFAGLLLVLSLTGVLAILSQPLPLPDDLELPFSEATLKAISLIQSGVILTMLILIGVWLAPKVGLGAPTLEGLLRGRVDFAVVRSQLIAGGIGGLLTGGVLFGLSRFAVPILPAEFLAAAEDTTTGMGVRMLYGGITEEVMLRWGVMTFLVWLGWRIFEKGEGKPSNRMIWLAIAGAAVLFGIGHLPAAIQLAGASMTSVLIVYIIGLNTIGGLVYGRLFARYGLSAAIWAHMCTHIFFWSVGAV